MERRSVGGDPGADPRFDRGDSKPTSLQETQAIQAKERDETALRAWGLPSSL